MKRKWIYGLTGICFLIIAACMSQPERFTEKRLVIRNKETVNIKELDISITNNGCGSKLIMKKGKEGEIIEGYEKAYCDIMVKTKDSTCHFGESFLPIYIKNLKLVIDNANAWGKKEDSIPPGGCRIIITRLDDLSR